MCVCACVCVYVLTRSETECERQHLLSLLFGTKWVGNRILLFDGEDVDDDDEQTLLHGMTARFRNVCVCVCLCV